ncbi:MAG: response regulator [Flavobacteriales bacterium]
MPIQVIVFDDNKHIRESLSLLFVTDHDFALCGAYENTDSAEELIAITKPDVVLMDIDMPGRNGIDAVGDIHKKFPELPIIMLTVFDDTERVFTSLRSGAFGYMLKSSPPHKLLEAIKDVHAGGAPMSPSIARKVMFHFQEDTPHTYAEYDLTVREREVLSHLVEGLSYKMIADKLNIGFETVRSHIKKIYEKLHVQTMTEAVSKTLKEKILDKK